LPTRFPTPLLGAVSSPGRRIFKAGLRVRNMEKKDVGNLAVAALAAIPLLIWLSLSQRFGSVGVSFKSLGQISALVAIVLFSITFVLAARIRRAEGFFGGLDKMLATHHIIGAIAFILLLFHPLLLAVRYLQVSAADALEFLLSPALWSVNFGKIALAIMATLLIITFFIRIRYQRWKFSHQLLGIAFIVSAFHVLLVSSDTSRSPLLRYCVLAFILAGIAAYCYRTVFRKFLVRTLPYSVAGVKELGKGVQEIRLSPKGKPLRYSPGQFAFISFHDRNVGAESHPFTISSSPDEKDLRITVKALGDYTSGIGKLAKGTAAEVEGPYGRFCSQEHHGKSQLWIAGGIGITPFLSLARSGKVSGPVNLYYSALTREEAVFLKEFNEIAAKRKNFKVRPFFNSENKGFLTAELIAKEIPGLSSREIFICGPPRMMGSLKEQLRKIGVGKEKMHSEDFGLR
jgi:predicted ferric reductase